MPNATRRPYWLCSGRRGGVEARRLVGAARARYMAIRRYRIVFVSVLFLVDRRQRLTESLLSSSSSINMLGHRWIVTSSSADEKRVWIEKFRAAIGKGTKRPNWLAFSLGVFVNCATKIAPICSAAAKKRGRSTHCGVRRIRRQRKPQANKQTTISLITYVLYWAVVRRSVVRCQSGRRR